MLSLLKTFIIITVAIIIIIITIIIIIIISYFRRYVGSGPAFESSSQPSAPLGSTAGACRRRHCTLRVICLRLRGMDDVISLPSDAETLAPSLPSLPSDA